MIAEAYGPVEIVEQAVRAEEAGFDFVEVSDHLHPWLGEHAFHC
ncbi:LLM class flavin-dependent oxidoreductase [Kribbella steppae]|nr:LLM class flavin-dependent oxidoreductase [Kribbella steppae]